MSNTTNISIKNLPSKFLDRLPHIIPQDTLDQVLKSFCHRKPSTFRANTLKISADELEKKLKDLGIETERVSWYKDAFILKNVSQKVLTETELYKRGYVYVQGLSSMIPALILDPKPHEKVLDITAAPGSKTTQMATLMENTGEILANDKSHVRNFKLKANITLQGVTNTHITQMPAQILWKKLPEYFDKTLVDVPCSMEGRFYTEDPKTYKDWSTKKIQFLEEQQKYILWSAISATKPGGSIVYSTCTLAPEENEGVIDWILKKLKDAIIIEEIFLHNVPIDKSIIQWNNRTYNQQIQKTVRILPSSSMEGFFIAKIKKAS